MKRIIFGFCITTLTIGICLGLFTLVVSGGSLYGSFVMTVTATIASYLGVIIGIPIYLILKQNNWVNVTSVIILGIICSILINIYPAYVNYQIDVARGAEISVTTTTFRVLRFAIPVGALAGLFLWYFGLRQTANELGNNK